MQGELKFIINLDFLVPVLIFPATLVNFYLLVAEQVTFVSENCSFNLPGLGELEGHVYISECGVKDRKETMKRAFFCVQYSTFCVLFCVAKPRHSKATGLLKDNLVLSPVRWVLEEMVFALALDLKV